MMKTIVAVIIAFPMLYICWTYPLQTIPTSIQLV